MGVLGLVADAWANRPKAWREIARPDQLPPAGEWREWLVIGGRGSGKTRTGAETLKQWITDDPGGEWAIIAPTYGDTWATCVEGPSGFLAAYGTTRAEVRNGKHPIIKAYWRSWAYIEFRDGTIVRLGSADDGALRIQGKNLKGTWCDEIGLWLRWETAWDESIQFAVREGISRIVATGTPKVSRAAAKLIRRLIKQSNEPFPDPITGVLGEPMTRVTRLRTFDNLKNLSLTFAAAVIGRAKGTRLERQELEGELLDDVEGALWTRAQIDDDRVAMIPRGDDIGLRSTVIGVDPADGLEDGDEQAYTVAGLGWDHELYVVESHGMHADVLEFLRHVVRRAVAWHARIVIEKNHGGQFLIATLEQVMRELDAHVPYEVISASQGKLVRAEPVAALCAQHKVHHVGMGARFGGRKMQAADLEHADAATAADDWTFVDLEDQLCSFTGNPKEKSPDRLDSYVYALTPYLNFARGPVSDADLVAAWVDQLDGTEEVVVAWQ